MKVSMYRNITDTSGKEGNLLSFLTTNKWQSLAEQIRNTPDKEERTHLKKSLPCCTPSGLFTERKKSGLIKHSGVICIDIDQAENPLINEWQSFVNELGVLNEILFAGVSVSGNGAFALIPIKYPEKHELHFKAIEEDFLRMGIVIDTACKDVSRLRFYAYNPKPYINKQATTYRRIYQPKPIIYKSFTDTNEVESLVKKIVSTNTNIVPDYESWFQVGGALSNVPNGRELFHQISRIDSTKYDYNECNRQFDHIKAQSGININTLFYYAKINGITIQ